MCYIIIWIILGALYKTEYTFPKNIGLLKKKYATKGNNVAVQVDPNPCI